MKYSIRQQWNMFGADVFDVVRLDDNGRVTHRFYGFTSYGQALQAVQILEERYG